MNKTVKWVLLSLNLENYSHVSIRKHGQNCVEYLGGGTVSRVLSRFGDMEITDSCIIDNVLCIYVR